MTDRPRTAPARPRRRRPSPLPVYAASLVAFLGITGFLGTRMAQGQDPALGAAKPKVAQVAQRRHVIVRKIVVTKHVTVVKPAAAATSAAPASAPAAQVQTSAPVQTYTPPPAPAPAPVQTATS